MNPIELIIIAIVTAIIEDMMSGKISLDPTLSVAQADPAIQQQAVDALAAYDKEHL